ncbi:hypothetical protein [Sinorhizobium meliloti]
MSEYLRQSKSEDAAAQRSIEGRVDFHRAQVSRAAPSNPKSDPKRAA